MLSLKTKNEAILTLFYTLQVSAFDEDSGDNGRITYSLSSDDTANYIRIDANTGEITASTIFDYDNR